VPKSIWVGDFGVRILIKNLIFGGARHPLIPRTVCMKIICMRFGFTSNFTEKLAYIFYRYKRRRKKSKEDFS
jgi:hypothetical protein